MADQKTGPNNRRFVRNMVVTVKKCVKTAPQGKIVITIDGPAGAGKSTLSKMIAREFGFLMLDSGAIYRAMAMALLKRGIPLGASSVDQDILDLVQIKVCPDKTSMKLFLNEALIGDEIRSEQIGIAASGFAVLPEVRRSLLDVQRGVARNWNIVAEGRDMGMVVFPDAFIKFFVTADLEERAKRRYMELTARGEGPDYEVVLKEMRARDHRDMSRKESPLAPGPDSITIDTTHLTQRTAVIRMTDLVEEKYHTDGYCRFN